MTFATARRPSPDSFFSLSPWRDRHFMHVDVDKRTQVSNPVANDAESLRLCPSSRPAALISPPRVLCWHRIVTSPQQLQTALRANRREEWGEGFGKFISPVFSSKVPAPATSRPAGSCCAAALPRLVGDACSRSLHVLFVLHPLIFGSLSCPRECKRMRGKIDMRRVNLSQSPFPTLYSVLVRSFGEPVLLK